MNSEETATKLEWIAQRLRDPRAPVLFIVAVFADAEDGTGMVRLVRQGVDPDDVARAFGEAQSILGTGAIMPVSQKPEDMT